LRRDFRLGKPVGIRLALGLGLDQFGRHLPQENRLNLADSEIGGQFALGDLKEILGGDVRGEIVPQNRGDLGDQFRPRLGVLLLALGVLLRLGSVRAGLAKLGDHLGNDLADFGLGLGDEGQSGGQSGGLGDDVLHNDTLSGL